MSELLTRVQSSALNLAMNVIKPDILIVLSPKDDPEQLCSLLTKHGLDATFRQDMENALESLKSHISSFLLLDFSIAGSVPFLEKVVDTFYDPLPYIIAVDLAARFCFVTASTESNHPLMILGLFPLKRISVKIGDQAFCINADIPLASADIVTDQAKWSQGALYG